jgi:hypothetical protein
VKKSEVKKRAECIKSEVYKERSASSEAYKDKERGVKERSVEE